VAIVSWPRTTRRHFTRRISLRGLVDAALQNGSNRSRSATSKNHWRNSLRSASYERWQRGTARIRPPLTLLSAGRTAISWCLLPAGSTAANLQQRFAAVGPCYDRQTDGLADGRTSYRYIDPAAHTLPIRSDSAQPVCCSHPKRTSLKGVELFFFVITRIIN